MAFSFFNILLEEKILDSITNIFPNNRPTYFEKMGITTIRSCGFIRTSHLDSIFNFLNSNRLHKFYSIIWKAMGQSWFQRFRRGAQNLFDVWNKHLRYRIKFCKAASFIFSDLINIRTLLMILMKPIEVSWISIPQINRFILEFLF